MVELTRRWFVFGSAAAVAAAHFPAPALADHFGQVTPMVTPVAFRHRRVFDIMASFDPGGPDEVAEVTLFVRGQAWFHAGFSTRSFFRWVAPPNPLSHIVVLPNDTFALEIKSRTGVGSIQMFVADTVDEGPPIHRCETHAFSGDGKPVVVMTDFDVDNSLAARLERQRQAEERAADEAYYAEHGRYPRQDWDDDEDNISDSPVVAIKPPWWRWW